MSPLPRAELSIAERAVLRTVIYSSLFDYPLTLEELQENLLQLVLDTSSILEVYRSSSALRAVIEYQDGYFFLRGRQALIQKRRQREAHSRETLNANGWILRLIGSIPYTRVVALSGSAAHLNVERGGDIDLFIIIGGNRVWSVAVTILLLTRLLGRRKMVCFNFLLSDNRLEIERKDLFNANQIIHLKPLIGEPTYRRFVEANPFVADFYPNFKVTPNRLDYRPAWILRLLKRTAEWILQLGLDRLQEAVCRTTYSWYLKRKSNTWKSPEEVVMEKDYLKLHTESHRKSVLQRFEKAFLETVKRMSGSARLGATD